MNAGVNSAAIPSELLDRHQWVAWWSITGEGHPIKLPNGRLSKPLNAQPKSHKLPINPLTGSMAATTRAETWSSYEGARSAVERWNLTGVGLGKSFAP